MNSRWFKKNRLIRRGVCVLTLLLFTAGTVVPVNGFSQAMSFAPAASLSLAASDITLPEGLGEIKMARDGTSGKIVIHIQDAHCNKFAQRKILSILRHIRNHYGIGLLNLEGGVRGYDTGSFTEIKDREIRMRVAGYFMDKGELSAAEIYAIERPGDISLWGVEDKELYLKNLDVFRSSLKEKSEMDEYLRAVRQDLEGLKKERFNKELLEMDSLYSRYRDRKIDLEEYFRFVAEKAVEKNIDFGKEENFSGLLKLLEDEKEIDFRKANKERDLLLGKLGKTLSSDGSKRLLEYTLLFRNKNIGAETYYAYLKDTAARMGVKREEYPSFFSYAEYIRDFGKIDKVSAIHEVETVEEKIRSVLYENGSQEELDTLSRRLFLLEDMFSFKLTRRDHARYLDLEHGLDPGRISSFLKKEGVEYDAVTMSEESIRRVNAYRSEVSAFFRFSFLRDDRFLENIRFDSMSNGQEAALIITGGFHSENLAALFRASGHGFVSIMPSFSCEEGYESPYFSLLAGEKDAFAAAVAPYLAEASALQKASRLCPALSGEVYTPDETALFRAEKKFVERAAVGSVEVELLDRPGGHTLFSAGSGERTQITVNDLLLPLGYPVKGSEERIREEEHHGAKKSFFSGIFEKAVKISSYINTVPYAIRKIFLLPVREELIYRGGPLLVLYSAALLVPGGMGAQGALLAGVALQAISGAYFIKKHAIERESVYKWMPAPALVSFIATGILTPLFLWNPVVLLAGSIAVHSTVNLIVLMANRMMGEEAVGYAVIPESPGAGAVTPGAHRGDPDEEVFIDILSEDSTLNALPEETLLKTLETSNPSALSNLGLTENAALRIETAKLVYLQMKGYGIEAEINEFVRERIAGGKQKEVFELIGELGAAGGKIGAAAYDVAGSILGVMRVKYKLEGQEFDEYIKPYLYTGSEKYDLILKEKVDEAAEGKVKRLRDLDLDTRRKILERQVVERFNRLSAFDQARLFYRNWDYRETEIAEIAKVDALGPSRGEEDVRKKAVIVLLVLNAASRAGYSEEQDLYEYLKDYYFGSPDERHDYGLTGMNLPRGEDFDRFLNFVNDRYFVEDVAREQVDIGEMTLPRDRLMDSVSRIRLDFGISSRDIRRDIEGMPEYQLTVTGDLFSSQEMESVRSLSGYESAEFIKELEMAMSSPVTSSSFFDEENNILTISLYPEGINALRAQYGLPARSFEVTVPDIDTTGMTEEQFEMIRTLIEEGARRRMRSSTELSEATKQMFLDFSNDAFCLQYARREEGGVTEVSMMPSELILSKGEKRSYEEISYIPERWRPSERFPARDENRLLEEVAESLGKTAEEIRKEIDDMMLKRHYQMYRANGFAERDDPQARIIYGIFEDLKKAYNETARIRGYPEYSGKLFIVDTPEVNAFADPARGDIFLFQGLVRGMADYFSPENASGIGGSHFSKEHIAAVLAHEMAHIMQGTSPHGIPFEQLVKEDAKRTEILDIKRNQEYDADEMSMLLMDAAGYNPRGIIELIDLLTSITPKSTLETTAEDHPHPKERKKNLQDLSMDKSLVTRNFEKPFSGLEREDFSRMYSRHSLHLTPYISSREELLDAIRNSGRFEELVGLLRMAQATARFPKVKAAAKEGFARSCFARYIFGKNIIQAVRALSNSYTGEDGTVTGDLVGNRQAGAYIANVSSSGDGLSPRDRYSLGWQLERNLERSAREVIAEINGVASDISLSDISLEEKKDALSKLDRIKKFFIETVSSLNEEDYEIFLRASPGEPGTDAAEIADAIRTSEETELSVLREVPVAVFGSFGKDRLDEKKEIELPTGEKIQAVMEREDPGIYVKDVRRWPLDGPRERESLFEVLLLSWINSHWVNGVTTFERDGLDTELYREIRAKLGEPGFIRFPSGVGTEEFEGAMFREKLALYLAEFEWNTPKGSELARFASEVMPFEETCFLPRLFSGEFGGVGNSRRVFEVRSAYSKRASAVQEQRADYEREGDFSTPGDIISRKLSAVKTGSEVLSVIRGETGIYSPSFRAKILRQLAQQSSHSFFVGGSLDAVELFALFKQIIPYADAAEIMLELLSYDVFKQSYARNAGLETYRAAAAVIEEIMDKRKPGDRTVPGGAMSVYIRSKIKERKAGGRSIDADFVYRTLERLSRHSNISLAEGPEGGFVFTENPEDEDILAGKVHLREQKVGSPDMPVCLFNRYIEKDEQEFFRKIFDLDTEQLQEIALNQERVESLSRETTAMQTGRLKDTGLTRNSDFKRMLDGIIILKLLDEAREGAGLKPKHTINSRDFEEVLSMDIRVVSSEDERAGIEKISQTTHIILFSDMAKEFNSLIEKEIEGSGQYPAGGDKEQFDARTRLAREFMRKLRRGFVKLKERAYSSSDEFFTRSSGDTWGFRSARREISLAEKVMLEIFPEYCDLMVDYQIPGPKNMDSFTRKHEEGPVDYKKAFLDRIDIEGPKARLFKKYDEEKLGLVSLDESLPQKLDKLEAFLPEASLYRDIYIHSIEKTLPQIRQIHPFLEGESLDDDMLTLIGKGIVNPFEEWERLRNAEFHIEPDVFENMHRPFYRRAVLMTADPQRQIRYGLTALKIYKSVYPDSTFRERFEAIMEFMPNPSKVRDDEIDALLEEYDIPFTGDDVPEREEITLEYLSREVLHQYSDYHRYTLDKEMNNMDMMIQSVRAMLSSAGRGQKKDFVLWLLDPRSYPKPEVLKKDEEQGRLFDSMPSDIKFLPQKLKDAVLKDIFLGEGGLLNPREGVAEDKAAMNAFAEALFNKYFKIDPSGKKGFKAETHGVLRSVFNSVIEHYNPARKTEIVLALLAMEGKLEELEPGDRLVSMLQTLGAVGIKVGQFLSENEGMITDSSMRRKLGYLKDSAEGFGKLGVLETLRAEGVDLSRLRIGRRLKAASMKQVHEAWYLNDRGEWERVAIKVLRPAIARTIEEDLYVLEKVLEDVRRDFPEYDVGNMAGTVRSWIDEERDFSLEIRNAENIADIVREYETGGRSGGDLLSFGVPGQVLVAKEKGASVMIEEFVNGVSATELFAEPWYLRESYAEEEGDDGRITARELSKRGFGPDEIKEILSFTSYSKRKAIKALLRKQLLYQIFEKGVFHADLHGGNVIFDAGTAHIIDHGLIGRLNEGQMGAAKALIRNILLKDVKGTVRAINSMIIAGGGLPLDLSKKGEDGSPEIETEIAEVFKKGTLKQRLNNISTKILKYSEGEASRDVGTFLKAFTQAIWLFPTGINGGFSSLKDIAEATEMRGAEFRDVLRRNVPEIVFNSAKGSLRSGLVFVRNICFWIYRKTVPSRFIREMLEKFERMRAGMRLRRLAGEQAENIIRSLTRFSGSEGSGKEEYRSDGPGRPVSLEIEPGAVVLRKKGLPPGVELVAETWPLEDVGGGLEISWKDEEDGKVTETYFRYIELLGLSGSSREFGLPPFLKENSEERPLLKELYAAEFGEPAERPEEDLIARELTARYILSSDSSTPGERSFARRLLPRNLRLAEMARELTDVYLMHLDFGKRSVGGDVSNSRLALTLFEGHESIRPEFHRGYRKGKLRLIVQEQPREPGNIVSREVMDMGLPPDFAVDRNVRAVLSGMKLKAPGIYETGRCYYTGPEGNKRQIIVTAMLVGYGEGGRVRVKIADQFSSEEVDFVLRGDEFEEYIRKGRIERFSLKKWEISEPVRGSPGEPEDSDGGFAAGAGLPAEGEDREEAKEPLTPAGRRELDVLNALSAVAGKNIPIRNIVIVAVDDEKALEEMEEELNGWINSAGFGSDQPGSRSARSRREILLVPGRREFESGKAFLDRLEKEIDRAVANLPEEAANRDRIVTVYASAQISEPLKRYSGRYGKTVSVIKDESEDKPEMDIMARYAIARHVFASTISPALRISSLRAINELLERITEDGASISDIEDLFTDFVLKIAPIDWGEEITAWQEAQEAVARSL
ncbi:MAG: M48 family metalloprotease [Candidatus Omnitrophica bacterium]|nr:M48 family metalloprotease [Candidatus Omnitrophota bacterium]